MNVLRAVMLALAVAACAPPEAQKASAADVGEIALLDSIESGARLTSPATITGIAPKNWYFENQFPISLIGADGAILAEGPAIPETSWTDPGGEPIRFSITLDFTVSQDTPATLVLQEDMPGEDTPPREVRIPVVLSAR
ncbi:MAG: hypothetical protein AB7Q23_16960 [Hyphomonadaceae bacterium]